MMLVFDTVPNISMYLLVLIRSSTLQRKQEYLYYMYIKRMYLFVGTVPMNKKLYVGTLTTQENSRNETVTIY